MFFSFIGYSQNWSKSFSAGNNDLNGNFLGGSEVLQLVGHKNKLYASVGYWEDQNNIWYGGLNNGTGWGQIISLDSPNGQWKEDCYLGSSFLRPEILKQIILTKDASGNTLTNPDTVLIAAGYSPNYLTNTVTVKSFTRDDVNNIWKEGQIVQGPLSNGESYSIRDIEVYKDQLTGIERVYATVGTMGIYAGTYNPLTPGKIDWIQIPEIGQLPIRSLGITTANNTLFFSSGNKLFKRDDGTSYSYSIAHDFSDLSININSAVGGIRGLTTIKNPNANNDALLLMWCPDGQSKGIIYRLEPDGSGGFNRFYETKISSLVENYLPGASVGYLLGAYNEFYEYVDPITFDTLHLIGFEAGISGGSYPTWNGYYSGGVFAKRDKNMQYSLEEINGTISSTDPALVANRCYVKSPFKNQENSIYFGGFDPNNYTATSMAWIYKKTFQTVGVSELSQEKIKFTVYPNPANDILNVDLLIEDFIEFEILSLIGTEMISYRLKPGKNSIDISGLSPNFYFMRIGSQLVKIIKY
ncbi:MAG: hypothetical protein CL846_02365 [Crocinitomicaceae bacterium]|nr:hypothetical protein [Crocinitomicaceae bacterium]